MADEAVVKVLDDDGEEHTYRIAPGGTCDIPDQYDEAVQYRAAGNSGGLLLGHPNLRRELSGEEGLAPDQVLEKRRTWQENARTAEEGRVKAEGIALVERNRSEAEARAQSEGVARDEAEKAAQAEKAEVEARQQQDAEQRLADLRKVAEKQAAEAQKLAESKVSFKKAKAARDKLGPEETQEEANQRARIAGQRRIDEAKALLGPEKGRSTPAMMGPDDSVIARAADEGRRRDQAQYEADVEKKEHDILVAEEKALSDNQHNELVAATDARRIREAGGADVKEPGESEPHDEARQKGGTHPEQADATLRSDLHSNNLVQGPDQQKEAEKLETGEADKKAGESLAKVKHDQKEEPREPKPEAHKPEHKAAHGHGHDKHKKG